MASTRASDVAEVLWELKRADKIATYTLIAERAGFSAGANGRAMDTCLKNVRRDWPHLQWWRAVKDDGLVEKDSEQAKMLCEAGFEMEEADDGLVIKEIETATMTWQEDGEPNAASTTAKDAN